MGFFTNNKKTCPVCGEGTPRLLATHIEDKMPICSACSQKISMPSRDISTLTLEALKAHLVFREENATFLESTFTPNKKVSVGWTHLNIDEGNKCFTIPLNMCGNTQNPPVFKFEELSGYELLEDHFVIERFNKGDSAPLYTPMTSAPIINIKLDDKDEKPETIRRSFTLKLYLKNLCWNMVESSAGSASGTDRNFQIEYNKHVTDLRRVTTELSRIIGFNIGLNATHGSSSQSNAGNIADDIMKFKELLDGGIITEDEFKAKKKQLLGL